MSLSNRQEYYSSVRHLVTVILCLVGDPIPHYFQKRMLLAVKFFSVCVFLYQVFIALFHAFTDYMFFCCLPFADPAVLLRLIYPHLIELNALIYQVIFLLNSRKIKRFLNELDRVVPYKPTSVGYRRGFLKSFILAVFALFLLLFTRISACGIFDSYYQSYNLPVPFCDIIYVIPRSAIWDKTLFPQTYNKIILQLISMWFSTIGVTFTEFWISNILHTLATAFEESHDNLVPILKEELKQMRDTLEVEPLQKSQKLKFGKNFQTWRKQHYQLRLATKRADSVLSLFALLHIFFTPILLCVAGFQLLQKNQEPFMRLFSIKSVVYYLICLCLVRMWLLCNAGEQLTSQVTHSDSLFFYLYIY